jgi:hypothetical protein
MTSRPSTLERAFELARAGHAITDIKKMLRAEGYMDAEAQLYGRALAASLKRARDEAAAATP